MRFWHIRSEKGSQVHTKGIRDACAVIRYKRIGHKDGDRQDCEGAVAETHRTGVSGPLHDPPCRG
jgi:hypothetical protein